MEQQVMLVLLNHLLLQEQVVLQVHQEQQVRPEKVVVQEPQVQAVLLVLPVLMAQVH